MYVRYTGNQSAGREREERPACHRFVPHKLKLCRLILDHNLNRQDEELEGLWRFAPQQVSCVEETASSLLSDPLSLLPLIPCAQGQKGSVTD
ncbi:hypothetical protein SKAU_G00107810 [Synaphobranchus kaupii]|uniref:Uncharacterized protein n=1 Tax=Synaphobranchus kaupii TaxID=118154 RepID=A0A9Q1G0L1_SYNKA|nr:hypothetical protein SKAU_G00107810 [Synaphobranchus kaupii]